MKIMTYNVENLFDTRHDTLKNDTEFLPNSSRKWNNSRYYKKIHNVMQVIVGIGGDEPPILVGLCEIENSNVLEAMIRYKPYNQLGYDYILYEGPDKRGIDVALLYLKDSFIPISSTPIPIELPNGEQGRDALYVCGKLSNGTIIHILQVHFPSRRGGANFSEPDRIAAANTIKQTIDEIIAIDASAGIIIMGDFNDAPFNYVPSIVLGALPYSASNSYENNKLYNLCWDGRRYNDFTEGTYFYDGGWDMLDQIIVSGSLLNGSLDIKLNNKAEIYRPKWLSTWNEKADENVPKRTYLGPFYQGGVSDHFPLFIEGKLYTTNP